MTFVYQLINQQLFQMALDKSTTHQRVIKNGEEGWIIKEMWDKMRSKGNTNGFSAVASTPPEVTILKQKKAEPDPIVEPEAEEVIDPELTGDAKPKGKPGPKPKQ